MGYRTNLGKKCSLCEEAAVARGLCRRHYNLSHKNKTLDQFEKVQPEQAFLSRIKREIDGCWIWTGGKNYYGYGVFVLPGEEKIRAHRYAYQLWNGPLSGDDIVLHSCDNPSCVNPAHLRKGTYKDNYRDAASKMRHSYGERHGASTLTSAQVDSIKVDQRTQTEIALAYGVNQSTVSRIKKGLRRSLG